jgi:phage-related protein (TIGR01555 family)
MLIKMAGLSNLLSQNRRKEVEQRLQVMNYVSSVLNVWLLDTTDGHEIVSRNFTGVAEMMKILKDDLGANTEIPHTSFFNQSPSGITSGESETKELNQTVLKYQKAVLKEPIERLISLYHLCKNGITGGIEPRVWGIDFPVIYEETNKEKQELAHLQAQERAIYAELGAITPDEVRKALALNLGLEGTIDLSLSQPDRTEAID